MKKTIAAAALAALVALSGCATSGGTKSKTSSKASVETRAQERWDHLIAHETDLAYDYLSPGSRSTVTRDSYARTMKDRPVHWTKAQVESKECASEDSCTVKVFVEYSAKLPMIAGGDVTSPAELEETWIAVDGVWYYVPADLVQGKGLR